MVYINFNTNLIERVGYDLFTPLNISYLQRIRFINNRCINRESFTQSDIITLINDLKTLCPFDDENLLTTTTSTESISTTTTTQEKTTENATCIRGSIKDFLCELDERVQYNLNAKEKRIKELELQNEKILEELEWMKIELLRLTTNPCACK
ncbi:hypothetical protein PVAND_014550 [Polypedilum vanderplanki]|uniref:Uncharacterized protein n=1 Tax=Polypedilum vanderplanki TaxID=319348 RepID=A0A9J6B9Z8_POLVA|nr:hypothetical protein PVAND_014550 [Polypedilum vanderplanki]